MNAATFGSTRVELVQGDITHERVDAIVNAANSGLRGGGGVDGAIHRAGGPEIMEACKAIRAKQGGCPTGTAVLTTAGRLHARCVIHTAGPVWGDQSATESDRLLLACYRACLALAAEAGCATVAFPSISTGVYGYPIERAAPLVLGAVRDFVQHQPFEAIRFVLFWEYDLGIYQKALDDLTAIGEST